MEGTGANEGSLMYWSVALAVMVFWPWFKETLAVKMPLITVA
jgi:hypothetical protein